MMRIKRKFIKQFSIFVKIDEAKSLTRKQRRANQRRKENSKVNIDHHSQINNEKPSVQVQIDQSSNDLWQTNLTAFDDLR